MGFSNWLIAELNARNWSQSELSRQADLTRAAISNYVSGQNPNADAMRKIAKAFKLPPEIVFRAAGILPPAVDDPWAEEMAHKINQLTGSRREMAERLLNTLLDEQDKQEIQKSAPKTRPAKP